MSEALERLKDIGAQKIYEKTHIPVECVQAILYENFEGLNKVHFLGFVSILEREYKEDLSSVRSHGIDYYDEKNISDDTIIDDTIFKPSMSKKKLTTIYFIGAIVLFVIAIVYMMSTRDMSIDKVVHESKIIQKQKSVVTDANISELNQSDVNKSSVTDINVTKTAKVVVPKVVTHTFKIIARTKVWLGYIDVAKGKKYQKIFKGDFELDPAKEWLLFFGHGYIDVIVDGKKEVFSSKNRLRLHYKDGEIQKLSLDDFKKLNKGKAW